MSHSEGATILGLPHILLINKVSGVETDTKLTNHGHVDASSYSLHEILLAQPCNGTKVVHEDLVRVSNLILSNTCTS